MTRYETPNALRHDGPIAFQADRLVALESCGLIDLSSRQDFKGNRFLTTHHEKSARFVQTVKANKIHVTPVHHIVRAGMNGNVIQHG